ncbi:MAG TPA: ABC transporter ATP-binding protein [Clostridia bacterium]|jgi:putative ABC transport system ATP-binding protein|nr:ATP-binding cassette domain-containing protein [Clostridiaceae bacterium]HHT93491.1 ATP-binding cassette domain-containing protein [Clostridiaceae bacterium]HOA32755.1 ABC transporter ATP-binding protein [Clostridia bacterium]HPZ52808.1 ABC transporter ATP-binding protein [Clostridia bacterium]
MHILSIKSLNFKNKIFYKDVNIEKGQIVFLRGASGSGKSTLLRLINATLPLEEGTILYNNKDIREIDTITLRREIILAGQSVYLFPGTIKDNFKRYHEYRESQVPSDEVIRSLLDTSCIDFDIDTVCNNFSGGERQRVFISIALSFKPRVLLLDEPTSALDNATADRLMSNLVTHCKQNYMTMIIVSHDQTITEKYAEVTIDIGEGVK